MFEWNDQELANIIWGEDGEADDHIVPFSEEIEKKTLPAAVDHDTKKLNLEHASSRAAEKKIPNSKTDSHDVRQDEDEGLHFTRAEPQPELCSFSTSRSDQNHIAKKAKQDHAAEVGQNQLDDTELGELVENSWIDIGSFDDLDQIFSSDDLGGRSPLAGTDELWPSSEDVIGATEKSLALDLTTWGLRKKERTSRHFEINVDYLHDQSQSFSQGYGKEEDFMMYVQESLHDSLDPTGHYVGRATGIFKAKAALGIPERSESYPAAGKVANAYKSVDKEYWCEDQSKHGQRTEKSDYRLLQNAHSSWLTPTVCVQHSDSQSASDLVQHHSSPLLNHRRKPRDSRSLLYQQLSTSYLAPYLYKDHTRQCIAMPVLQSTNDEHQSVLSCYEPSPGYLDSVNNLAKASVKPLNMTPQEKIEKLRRRQKLRAMLAIQKQQQQLIPTASCSVRQRSFQQDPNLLMERADVTTPCYDTNSPMKWDDIHEIPVDANGHTLEDTVIHQLQDVISKLDIKIRLCIRDSLFRLARSAHQRHSVTDTSHTMRSSPYELDVAKEELSSHDRFLKNSNMETETNHIDRAIASLLFHRPVMLPEKYSGSAESSTSTKVPLGQVAGVLSSLPVGSSAKNSENEHTQSLHGSKHPGAFVDTHHEGFFEDILDSKASANQNVKEKMLEHVSESSQL